MTRDDCILIALKDVSGHATASHADARPVPAVRGFIQIQTCPSATAADRSADHSVVLTNSSGENDSVQSAALITPITGRCLRVRPVGLSFTASGSAYSSSLRANGSLGHA